MNKFNKSKVNHHRQDIKFLKKNEVNRIVVFSGLTIEHLFSSPESTVYWREPLLRHTAAIFHDTEAIFRVGKLLPCGETNLPDGEAKLPCGEAKLPCYDLKYPYNEPNLPCAAKLLPISDKS